MTANEKIEDLGSISPSETIFCLLRLGKLFKYIRHRLPRNLTLHKVKGIHNIHTAHPEIPTDAALDALRSEKKHLIKNSVQGVLEHYIKRSH